MKILFITHNASRSGAPLVLLYLIQWIQEFHKEIEMHILFVDKGSLEDDFKALVSKYYYLNASKRSTPKFKLLDKVLKKIGVNFSQEAKLYQKLDAEQYDLIYSNTIVSIPYGHRVKKRSKKAKHLVHVHELETIIKTLLPNFKNFVKHIDSFIAVSGQVKEDLVNKWLVPQQKINVIFGCAKVYLEVKKSTKSNFVVGASGLSYWRKGNDLFLQVARYIKKHYPELEIVFKWIGHEYLDKPIIDADIEKLRLNEIVDFVGEVQDPAPYFNSFDVFLLPSREDPFPLVCIEVAHLQKPIICFEKASGTSEIVKKGGGFVVPYLDIEAMAEKIVYYYNNRDLVEEHGKEAYQLFKDFRPEKICPQLYDEIKVLLNIK